MSKLAIIVREDAYDRILTPLSFAYLGVASDMEVDMLFVNWAARVLTKGGAENLKVSKEHEGSDEMVKAKVAEAGLPTDIYEIIKALKATGKVRMYVCSLAASIFGVTRENLVPEAEDIVGATWFLLEKAEKADTVLTL
ncbi:hypothetical protein IPdc08_01010 [archaeon]|nr:hypothetical protein IPdc08_01010 [archaeon]